MREGLELLPLPRFLHFTLGRVSVPTLTTETIDPAVAHPQGYRIDIAPGRVDLIGHDPPGLF
ncbi:MAG TPA: hypothetical protein VGR35_05320 [Tepidisphaeraceae bacterium]|nr:hypothetical protein [Tepidisphaeraceae bacterium]